MIGNQIAEDDTGERFYRCEFLATWNCRHIANANNFGHIRRVNGILGFGNPTLVSPSGFRLGFVP